CARGGHSGYSMTNFEYW
nr:immunoglobulin heavy chain junction region [Macaca mulatta]